MCLVGMVGGWESNVCLSVPRMMCLCVYVCACVCRIVYGYLLGWCVCICVCVCVSVCLIEYGCMLRWCICVCVCMCVCLLERTTFKQYCSFDELAFRRNDFRRNDHEPIDMLPQGAPFSF